MTLKVACLAATCLPAYIRLTSADIEGTYCLLQACLTLQCQGVHFSVYTLIDFQYGFMAVLGTFWTVRPPYVTDS